MQTLVSAPICCEERNWVKIGTRWGKEFVRAEFIHLLKPLNSIWTLASINYWCKGCIH